MNIILHELLVQFGLFLFSFIILLRSFLITLCYWVFYSFPHLFLSKNYTRVSFMGSRFATGMADMLASACFAFRLYKLCIIIFKFEFTTSQDIGSRIQGLSLLFFNQHNKLNIGFVFFIAFFAFFIHLHKFFILSSFLIFAFIIPSRKLMVSLRNGIFNPLPLLSVRNRRCFKLSGFSTSVGYLLAIASLTSLSF